MPVVAIVLLRRITMGLEIPSSEPALHERLMHDPPRALALDDALADRHRIPLGGHLRSELRFDIGHGGSAGELSSSSGSFSRSKSIAGSPGEATYLKRPRRTMKMGSAVPSARYSP